MGALGKIRACCAKRPARLPIATFSYFFSTIDATITPHTEIQSQRRRRGDDGETSMPLMERDGDANRLIAAMAWRSARAVWRMLGKH